MPDLWSQLQSYGDIEGISHEIVLKVIACIVALTLFALGTNAATLNVKKVLRWFRRPSAQELEIERLTAELEQKQEELAGISPTNEFAKYFRLERNVNKLSDELKALVAESQTSAFVGSILQDIIVRTVCAVLALSLAYYSSDLVLFRIRSTHFYPINWILSFPNMSWGDTQSQEVPITVFNYVAMGIFARSVYKRRCASAQKQKLL